ncbi:MAG: sugar phosphate isomerase/epimerase [Chloroflexota bacterium]|nr:MAG: sugar phosphate isomerase/epimerase [Chloroflexota bacterium]
MDRSRMCVSTWSLHQSLGPRLLTKRDANGVKQPHQLPHPKTMTLFDFLDGVRPKLDIDNVEICGFHVERREPTYVAQLKAAIARNSLNVVSMPIDAGNISIADPTYREDDLREIEGWMDFAADLGVRYVRANAQSYVARDEVLGPLSVTIDSYGRLCDHAARRGMVMTIENHGGMTVDPDVILAIIAGVGGNRLKVCMDTGNFPPIQSHQMNPVPPTGLDPAPLYRDLAKIAPYTAIIHAKSIWFDGAGNHLVYDLAHTLRLTRDAGFTGPVSIEYGAGVDEWGNCLKTKRLIEGVFA